ncbi:MAG: pitrilysin family protein [Gammaproteobacteria bacterium]|nr:pitrilysin family protein [Gammaproteobacteria bacterium]
MSIKPVLAVMLMMAVVLPARALPAIESWTSADGARVLYVHAPEIPMVDVELVFDAGAARDGDLDGLARMVNSLLEEGADGLDADAIATGFEDLGAVTGFSSQRDMASVSLRSLSAADKLAPASALLARLVARPDFPATAVERIRNQLQSALMQTRQSPGELANRAFYEALYPDHPYGAHPGGTEASLERITQDTLKAFHDRYYVAANAVVAVVGDIGRADAETLVDELLADLPRGERAPPPEGPGTTAGAALLVPYPAEQVHLLMGQRGMRRGDPDYFPLYLGNHILGGSGLVSRLSKAVREERGLSYSVSSRFIPMRGEGPFKLSLQTKSANAGEAVAVVGQVLEEFVAEGPAADELRAAKDNIINGFPLRVDSNAKIGSYLVMMGFYDLPLDYLNTFTARVEDVTAAQVRDAFARRVDPRAFVKVLAGDLDDAQREALGLVVRDVE